MKLLTANANTANITTDYWQVIAADDAAGAISDLTKFSVGTITDESGGIHYANAEDVTKFFLGDSVSVGQTIGGKTEGFGTLGLPTDKGQIYGDNFVYVEDTSHFKSGDSLVILEGLKAGEPPYSDAATSPDGFVSEFTTVGVVGLIPTMSTDLYEGIGPQGGGIDSALLLPSNNFLNFSTPATILQKNSVFVGNANSNYYTPMLVPPTPDNVGAPSGSGPMYVACSGDPQALVNMLEIFPDFVAFSFTGTLTVNSNVITDVSETDSLEVGQVLTGLGIPLGTHIAAIDTGASTITMTNIATVAADSFLNPLTASGGQITDIEVGASYTQITLQNAANAALLGFSPGKTMTLVFYIASPNSYAPVGWNAGIITAVDGNVITTDFTTSTTLLYGIPIGESNSFTFPYQNSFSVQGTTGNLVDGTFQQTTGGIVFQPSAFMEGFPLGGMIFGDGDGNIPTVSFTGDTIEGTNLITNVSSTTGLAAFQVVNDGGAGLAPGTWITSYDATAGTVTINQDAIATTSGDTITAWTSVFYSDGTYTYLTNAVTNDESTFFTIDYVVTGASAFANQLEPESLEVNTSGGNIFVATPYCAPYLYSDGINNPSNGAFLVVPLSINAYDGSVASVTSINSNSFTGNYVSDTGYYGENPRIINAMNYSSLVGEVNPPIADANDPSIFGPIANVAVLAQGGITAVATSSYDADFLGLDQVYAGIMVGMPVDTVPSGGLPSGTVVTSVSGNTIGINHPSGLTNATVVFGDTTVLLPSTQGGAAELAAQAASIVTGMAVTDTQGYIQPGTQVGSPPFVNPPIQFTGTYTATAANFHTETVTENYYLNADGGFASVVSTGGFTNASSVAGGTTYTFTATVADSSNVLTVSSDLALMVANSTQAGVIGWTITSDDVVLTTALSGGDTFVGALVDTDPTDGTITMVDSTGTPIPWSSANGGATSGTFLLTHPIHLMGIIPDAGYFKILTPVQGSRIGSAAPITTTTEILPTVGVNGMVLLPQDAAPTPTTFTATYQAGTLQIATTNQPGGLAVGDIIGGPAGIVQSGTQITAITVNGGGYIIDLSQAPLGPINLFKIKFAANAVNSITTIGIPASTPFPTPAVGQVVSDVNLNNCITNVFPSSANAANPQGSIFGPPGGGIVIEAITPTLVGGVLNHYGLTCQSEFGAGQPLTLSPAQQGTNYYGYTYSNAVLSASFTNVSISPNPLTTLAGAAIDIGDTHVTVGSSVLTLLQMENYFMAMSAIPNQPDVLMHPAFNVSVSNGSWYSTTEAWPITAYGGPSGGGVLVDIGVTTADYLMPGTLFPAPTWFQTGSVNGVTPGAQIEIGSDIFFVDSITNDTILCSQTVNELTAAVTAGATTLTVPSVANIVAGSNVTLGYTGLSEVLNVLSISGTTLTFTSPVVNNYPAQAGPNGTSFFASLYAGFATQEYPIGTTVTIGTGVNGDTIIAISGNEISANQVFYPGVVVTITPEGTIPTPPSGQVAGSETVVVESVDSSCTIQGDLDPTTSTTKMFNCLKTQGAAVGQKVTSANFAQTGGGHTLVISHVDPVGTDGGSIGGKPTITFTGGTISGTQTAINETAVDPNGSQCILTLQTGCLHYHAISEQILLPLKYGGPKDPSGEFLFDMSWQDNGDAYGLVGATFVKVLPSDTTTPTTAYGVTDPTSGGIPADCLTYLNKAIAISPTLNVLDTPNRKVGVWMYLSNGQYLHGMIYGPGTTVELSQPAVPAGRTAVFCQWYDKKFDNDVLTADGYNATKIVTGGGVVAGATITDVVLTATSPGTDLTDLSEAFNYVVTGSGISVGPVSALHASVSSEGPVTTPLTITAATNDTFFFTQGGGLASEETFTIAPGTYNAMADVVTAVAAATGSISTEAFSAYVTVTNDGPELIFTMVTAGASSNGNILNEDDGGLTAIGFTDGSVFLGGRTSTTTGAVAGQALSLPTTQAVFIQSTLPEPLASGGSLVLTSSAAMPIGTFTATFTATSLEFGINITKPVELPTGDQGNWPTLATFTTFATNINTQTNVISLSNTVLNGKITPRSFLGNEVTGNALIALVTDPAESPTPLVINAAIAGFGVATGTKVLDIGNGVITIGATSTEDMTPGVLSLGDPEAFRSANAPVLTVDDSTEMLALVTEGTTTFVYQNLIFTVGLGSFNGDDLTITTTSKVFPPLPQSGDYAPNFPRAGVFVWENTISDDSAIENWTTAARVPPVAGVITAPKPLSYSHSPGTLVASYASGGRYFGSTTVGDLEFVIPTQVGSLYGSTLDVGITANASNALVVSPLPITIHNTGPAVDGSLITYQSIADLDLMQAGGIVIVGMGTTQEAVLLSGSSSRVDGKSPSSQITNGFPDVPVTWTLAAGQAFAYNHEPGEPVFLPNITADIFTASQTYGPTGIASTFMTLNAIAGDETLSIASTDSMYIGANLFILDGANSEYVQVNTSFTGVDVVPLVAPFVNSHTGVPYPAILISDANYIYAGPFQILGTVTGLSATITGVTDTTGLEADMPLTVFVSSGDVYGAFTMTIASVTSDTITLTEEMLSGQDGEWEMIAGTPDNWTVGQTIVGTGFEGVLGEQILSVTENQVFIGGETTSIDGGTGILVTTMTAFPTVITNYNAVVVPTNITDLTTFPIGSSITPIGVNSIPLGTIIDAVTLQPHEVILNLSAPATIQTPTFAVGAGFTLTHAQGSPILGSAEVEDNTPSLVASNTSGTDAINATALVGMTTPWYAAGDDGAPSVDTTFAIAAPAGASLITLSSDAGFGESYPSVYQYNSMALPEIGRVIGEMQAGRTSIMYSQTGDMPLTFPVFIKLGADEYVVESTGSDTAGNPTLLLSTATVRMYPDMTSIHTTSFDTSSTYTQIDVPHFYLSGVNFLCLAAGGVSVIQVSRLDGLAVGMSVGGIGIPAGTSIGGLVAATSSIYIVDVNGNPVLTTSPINNTPLTFGGADIAAGEWFGLPDWVGATPPTTCFLYTTPSAVHIPAGSTITLSYAGYTQEVTMQADVNPSDVSVAIVPVKSNYAFGAAVGANGVFTTQGTSCYVTLDGQLAKGDVLFLSENGYSQSLVVSDNTAVGTEYIAVEEFIPNYPYDDNVTPVSFAASVNPGSNIVTFASPNDYFQWAAAMGEDGVGLAITTGGGAFEVAPTIQELIKTSLVSAPLLEAIGLGANDVTVDTSLVTVTAVFEVTAGSNIVNWISGDPILNFTGGNVLGWGIPAGTTIASYNESGPVGLTLSTPATANGAGPGNTEILYQLIPSGHDVSFLIPVGAEPVMAIQQVSCTAGENTFIVGDPSDILVGMALWGDGIYSSTTVQSVDGNQITMSQNAYATTSGSYAYFSPWPYGTTVLSVNSNAVNFSDEAIIAVSGTPTLLMTGVTGLRLTQTSVVTIPTTTVFSLGGIMFSAPQGLVVGTGSTQETVFTTGQPFINDDGSATVSLLEPTKFEHSAGEAITYNDFPSNPSVGDVMYNSVKGIYQMYDGNTWRTSRVNYVQPHYAVKVDAQ